MIPADGNGGGGLRPATEDEIVQVLDKYCGERHPDADLWRAAEDLITRLGGSRPNPGPPVGST